MTSLSTFASSSPLGSSGGTLGWVALALCCLATIPAGLRWLRVAQREHYLAGSVTRFAFRWWKARPTSGALFFVGLVSAGVSIAWPVAAVVTAVVCGIAPFGLRLRARTSPLAWTPRLIRLTVVYAVLIAVVVAVVGSITRVPTVAALTLLGSPALLDAACALVSPVESRMLEPFLKRASERVARVRPRVVAVTGSYGKTSTKQAIAHILSETVDIVATPASFNNRAGLARAINEHLSDGTQVFIAEMGTYGSGEIAELCKLVEPEVSVITAIGPVHLERFGSEENVLKAKSEILAKCRVAVLATDDPRLSELADQLVTSGRQVIRCSTSETNGQAEDQAGSKGVTVNRKGGVNGTIEVSVDGKLIAKGIHNSARESNLACAVGVVVALGLPLEAAVERLATVPSTSHRLEPVTGTAGALLLDDTYNSNPAGAGVALEVLAELGAKSSRRVVVTPGMVELGRLQQRENAAFATSAAKIATDLVVVGRTNRRALLQGAALGRRENGSAALNVVEVPTRDAAVEWVRANAGPGDVVLYENDLPDHYP